MKVKWRDIALTCFFIAVLSSDRVTTFAEANNAVEDITRIGLSEVCHPGDVCVRKCCSPGQMMTAKDNNCTSIGPLHLPEWKPKIGSTQKYSLLFGFPPQLSSDESVCVILDRSDYVLNEKNGKIVYKESQEEYSHEFYCLDYQLNDDGEVTEFGVACITVVKKSSFDRWADVFHRLGLGISSLCLLGILILYLVSPDGAELPSKCIITCCVNLLASFLLIILNMTQWVTMNISQPVCVTLGLSIQFFFLSFYFWLNVLMYNIFKVYQQVLSGNDRKVRPKDNERTYIRYAIYAFGVPAAITVITAIMQSLPFDDDSTLIRPRIGEGRCWFPESGYSLYLYYYGFEVLLHIVNVIIITRGVCLFNGEEARKSPFRQQLFKFRQQFYVFTLFAFIWMLNLLTLIDSHSRIWRVLDILISLQGVFFLVIVIKYGKDMWQDAFEKVSNLTKSIPTSFRKPQTLRTKSQERGSVMFY